jgi:hypothetical protein
MKEGRKCKITLAYTYVAHLGIFVMHKLRELLVLHHQSLAAMYRSKETINGYYHYGQKRLGTFTRGRRVKWYMISLLSSDSFLTISS